MRSVLYIFLLHWHTKTHTHTIFRGHFCIYSCAFSVRELCIIYLICINYAKRAWCKSFCAPSRVVCRLLCGFNKKKNTLDLFLCGFCVSQRMRLTRVKCRHTSRDARDANIYMGLGEFIFILLNCGFFYQIKNISSKMSTNYSITRQRASNGRFLLLCCSCKDRPYKITRKCPRDASVINLLYDT